MLCVDFHETETITETESVRTETVRTVINENKTVRKMCCN